MSSVPVPTDVDDAFGHWLAGFIDGEGCFQVVKGSPSTKQAVHSYRCYFDISLRADDEAILRECIRRTGLGRLHSVVPNRGRPAARWAISDKEGALALVAILDRFPLRAKKARDYAIWRRAVLAWQRTRKGGNVRPVNDYSEMSECAALLRELRARATEGD